MRDVDELIETFGKQQFVLKEEHLKLLRQANVGWHDCEFGAPAIDCKRPYGNSQVYDDIAEILGITPVDKEGESFFSDEQKELMDEIHLETKTALQIVLFTGKFETGLYESPQYHSHLWRKTKEG